MVVSQGRDCGPGGDDPRVDGAVASLRNARTELLAHVGKTFEMLRGIEKGELAVALCRALRSIERESPDWSGERVTLGLVVGTVGSKNLILSPNGWRLAVVLQNAPRGRQAYHFVDPHDVERISPENLLPANLDDKALIYALRAFAQKLGAPGPELPENRLSPGEFVWLTKPDTTRALEAISGLARRFMGLFGGRSA